MPTSPPRSTNLAQEIPIRRTCGRKRSDCCKRSRKTPKYGEGPASRSGTCIRATGPKGCTGYGLGGSENGRKQPPTA